MVEYAVEEALELLEKNIASATASLRQTEVDTRFLKEQITTTEVSILPLLMPCNACVWVCVCVSMGERLQRTLPATTCNRVCLCVSRYCASVQL